MSYRAIDPRQIRVRPLCEREHQLHIEEVAVDPDAMPADCGADGERIARLAARIHRARERGGAVMLAYGAHAIKNGCGPLLRRLIDRGWVTHLATQGAGIIHDWEFAHIGRSGESVRDNAVVGRFGMWDETGRAVNVAALFAGAHGLGLGEAIGKLAAEDALPLTLDETAAASLAAGRADLAHAAREHELGEALRFEHPWRRFNVAAAAYERRVPLTVHPGIGYDIYACHPLFHGGAIGRAAATDFRTFVESVSRLGGGVYLSVGSAIMSPQVFEKAFSIANNLRAGRGEPLIGGHHIAVVDLQSGGDWDWSAGEPPHDHPAYYLRFCKSFYRMLPSPTAPGTLDYLQMDNRTFLANLVKAVEDGGGDGGGKR